MQHAFELAAPSSRATNLLHATQLNVNLARVSGQILCSIIK